MDIHLETRNEQLLSSRENLGMVVRCPNGCIHILVHNLAFRLSEKQYWNFMEMLSESATNLAAGTGNPSIH